MNNKKNYYIFILFTILTISLTVNIQAIQCHEIPNSSPRLTPTVKAVYKSLPAVVNISTKEVVRMSDPYEALFQQFFKQIPQRRRQIKTIPLGSGVIIDEHGLIVTNYHVIQRASNIMITLWDGGTATASLLAFDEDNDLALLQLHDYKGESPLTAIRFSCPGDIYLGETVITIGNPFGLEHSVAQGVLSAKNRTLQENNVIFHDIIQTDAAINPGNSGGPLINLEGNLIGLNLAIRPDSEGIGFAIPMSRIGEMLSQWLIPYRFSDSLCGIIPTSKDNKSTPGFKVGQVIPNSPAEKAGIKTGDYITEMNGIMVNSTFDAGKILWTLKGGDILKCVNSQGKTSTIKLRDLDENEVIGKKLKVSVQPLTDNLKQALNLPDNLDGLAISEILGNSFLGKTGIKRGDIITKVENKPISSINDLYNGLKSYKLGSKVMITVVTVETYRKKTFLRGYNIDVILN